MYMGMSVLNISYFVYDNLGLSLNLQFGQVDHRYPDILGPPEDNKTANILSADNRVSQQFTLQQRLCAPGVTHQKSWCSGRAPLSLYTLWRTGERNRWGAKVTWSKQNCTFALKMYSKCVNYIKILEFSSFHQHVGVRSSLISALS